MLFNSVSFNSWLPELQDVVLSKLEDKISNKQMPEHSNKSSTSIYTNLLKS